MRADNVCIGSDTGLNTNWKLSKGLFAQNFKSAKNDYKLRDLFWVTPCEHLLKYKSHLLTAILHRERCYNTTAQSYAVLPTHLV